ncbi:cupin domain-containing protein [Roseicella aerolata]|uniref:Cupin domain-containing protein n=1 Tax=Roseicella aerolata TaxID=2883479 RepID=A0A9X1IIB8_9PROT|nr:cupin domain-containing protein [Roseicella aerolata]MCB4825169.1 cupin domain-containing protein [Roseicella aerolata]
MKFGTQRPRATWRSLGLAGIYTAAMLAGGGAVAEAGQCPVDKVIAPASSDPPRGAATTPKDVTDTVIGSIDLRQEEAVGVNNRLFRLRRLVVQPGGVVPWHSHGNRPALIYIVEGEITEYASTCSVPILHRAGETAPETHATAHWWKNIGRKPVVLLSADLFPTTDTHTDAHTM